MFWDSSALVPVLLPEPRSPRIVPLLGSDPEPALWWASPVECQSAIHRRHREDRLPAADRDRALSRLSELASDFDLVSPTTRLRDRAGRLLAAHPLRAGDALQLAAALVCLDEQLRQATRREGFTILPA